MNFRVQRCTLFIRAPLLGPFITIPVILIRYKYPTLYIFPKDVNSSSVPNIGNRTQHLLIHILLACMAPGVPFTMIVLPRFKVVGHSLALCLLTRKNSLYRLCLATLLPLYILLMLVMTHTYMMISISLSLTTLLFAFALWSLTVQLHCLHIRIRLHMEKLHIKMEGVNTHREPHILYVFLIQREINQVYFIFC